MISEIAEFIFLSGLGLAMSGLGALIWALAYEIYKNA